jgi:putative transposase
MMEIVEQRPGYVSTRSACEILGLSCATYYRRLRRRHGPHRRRSHPRALSVVEREQVLAVLHEPRFADKAAGEVYAMLLDEGRYLCSERTMYRILASAGEVKERRNQLRHPAYAKPELLATRPNELWSWDISVPQLSGVRDGGRSPGIALQGEISNHHKRPWSKALVVSVMEKVH